MNLFHCPDCRREHDEPAHATFVLAVQCLECALAVEGAAAAEGTLTVEGLPLLEAAPATANAAEERLIHAA